MNLISKYGGICVDKVWYVLIFATVIYSHLDLFLCFSLLSFLIYFVFVFTDFKDEGDVGSSLRSTCTQKRVTNASSFVHWAPS